MNGPMYQCPRFAKCAANVCPLDPDWHQRTHGAGDKICFYLLEAVKPGATARFKAVPAEELHQGVLRPLADMCSRWGAIRKAVERAQITGSRMDRIPPSSARQPSDA